MHVMYAVFEKMVWAMYFRCEPWQSEMYFTIRSTVQPEIVSRGCLLKPNAILYSLKPNYYIQQHILSTQMTNR